MDTSAQDNDIRPAVNAPSRKGTIRTRGGRPWRLTVLAPWRLSLTSLTYSRSEVVGPHWAPGCGTEPRLAHSLTARECESRPVAVERQTEYSSRPRSGLRAHLILRTAPSSQRLKWAWFGRPLAARSRPVYAVLFAVPAGLRERV